MVVVCGALWLVPTIKRANLQAKRERWQNFLRELPPQARDFYIGMDRRLAERAQKYGSIDDLAKVGTEESGYEMWGPGP